MARDINLVYEELNEKFDILIEICPKDPMSNYQELITRHRVLIEPNSGMYNEFMRIFNLTSGASHSEILIKCLDALTARINELQKQSKLENKIATN